MKRRLCILLTCVLTLVTAQAPGDENELCTVTFPANGRNMFVDPPNQVPLMDTSHYRYLLPGNPSPVWQSLDLDSNNPGTFQTEWVEQGDQCESQLTVCGYTEGSQNNWLISQHINATLENGVRLSQVTMLITYTQASCPTTVMGGANACQRVFDVRKFETSLIDSVAAQNTSNYEQVSSLTTNQGSQQQSTTVDIDLSTSESGFYLAIIDPGTCIVITRVVVFYYICPAENTNLVMHPETLAPPVGSPSIQVSASCVQNAVPRTENSPPTLRCLEEGEWLESESGCVCDSGFTLSPDGQQCIKCEPGFYASVAQEMCVICPNNSNSTIPGEDECPCDEGFYRTDMEIDLPCTLPPSEPLNVRIVSISSTTIGLAWDEPVSTGGRSREELRYNLWYQRDGESESEIILSDTVATTMGLIEGLMPDVRYIVYVTSETAITNQINNTASLLQARGVALLSATQSISPGTVAGIVVAVLVIIIVLVVTVILLLVCYLKQKKVVKETISHYANPIELPKMGRRMYVDPTTYASPDEAVKDFAEEIPPRSIRLLEEIGTGEFGNVYKGVWKNGGKQIPIAVKTLKPGSSFKLRSDFLTEASIMGQFNHPHVIKLHGVVTKVEPAMIVMEFMEKGSLYHYLRKNDDKFSVERQVKMARGVASGMDYLSTVGFVHRDLAARNVLVAKDETCKVADFGLSRETVDDEYDVKKGGKIPVRWTAPEAIFRRRFTSASDVWSYGILLWEIMSYAQNPYEAMDWDNQTVLDKVDAGYRLDKPDGCPQSVYGLMLNCWHADKNDRPTFAEIVQYIDQLLENKMEVNLPNPAPAKKVVPKTYLTSAHILSPLDYNSLEEWLLAIKMERYQHLFLEKGYKDINQVLPLTEANLREMGITLAGHLYRITSSIEKAQTQLERQPSLKV